MIANKINGKQTKLTWGGVKYKAQTVLRNECLGCAFDGTAGNCPRVVDSVKFPCTPSSREDGQAIVWIKRKKQPTQGEQA